MYYFTYEKKKVYYKFKYLNDFFDKKKISPHILYLANFRK